MARKPLTQTQVDDLTKVKLHWVGPTGLYLQIAPNGARSWILRFKRNGKDRQMGLGAARLVTLKDARERAHRAQYLLLDGIDPIEARNAEREQDEVTEEMVPTFAQAARQYIRDHEAEWTSALTLQNWRQSIKDYALPRIGSKPVDSITVKHVADVLRPLWTDKRETAGRLRGRIERILDWAIARGYRTDANPAQWSVLRHVLPNTKVDPEHHAALPYAELPDFMARLRGQDGIGARALEICILTAARTKEVLEARWSEVDLDEAVWHRPAERMKARKPHSVPLAPVVVELLQALPREGEFVFGGAKPPSNMVMAMVLRRMEVDATVHGMRSCFADWAAEQTDADRDVREMALAHAIENKVEAAYRRGALMDKRRVLMEQWAAYCLGSGVR